MSFSMNILLSEKKMSKASYFAFLDACSLILGEWRIHESVPFSLNSDEVVHECVLLATSSKYIHSDIKVSVWITLTRESFAKRYSRGRKQVNWMINTETKAGRDCRELAIQMLIPSRAFDHFSDIVVDVGGEKIFLHPKNYQSYVMSELMNACGEDELKRIGLFDSGDSKSGKMSEVV